MMIGMITGSSHTGLPASPVVVFFGGFLMDSVYSLLSAGGATSAVLVVRFRIYTRFVSGSA